MIPRQKRRTKGGTNTTTGTAGESHFVSEDSVISHSLSASFQFPNSPLIYSAPTVETLGDDAASIRPYATPRPPPPSAAATAATMAPSNNEPSLVQKSDNGPKAAKDTPSNVTARRRRHRHRHSSDKTKTEKEFQKPEDAMSVAIRTIPVAERSAFDVQPAPSLAELAASRRSLKKASPSPLHLQIIHKLQNIQHVRQLAFSPSVGGSSDILYPGESNKAKVRRRRSTPSSSSRHRSDGRYQSIDPVQATLSALPPTPPLLSNKRHRLPMRADVGFPNASAEEIQKKQGEINQETEWEEASPRLIVLVTSDDLGTAAVDLTNQGDTSNHFLAYAGPELLAAKWQNQQHFSRNKAHNNKQPAVTANRYSVLAPPLDSTYSSTYGWRPRPFHDRPPGLRYTLVSPIQLEFGIGNIEPLVCSLSLYRLGAGDLVGKASEEFYFPAGDWRGKLNIAAFKDNDDLASEWLKRKHKALFAIDPLVTPTHDLYVVLQIYKVTHLELAMAYVMGKTNGGTPTHEDLPKDKKSWKKRLRGQSHKGKGTPEGYVHRASYRASVIFDAYGTQFLSPLCFGVTSLHHSSSKVEEYAWPAGRVHDDMMLYTYPSNAESQNDFVRRLWKLVSPSQSSTGSDTGTNASPRLSRGSPTSGSPIADASTPSQRRKGISRFVSPKKVFNKEQSDISTTSTNQKQLDATPTIQARVSLFVSDLQADFLEAMLQTPPELADKGTIMSNEENHVLPKLLVDVSGTCAIMMDPRKVGNVKDMNKRSNLVRLPHSRKSYLDASDFREVWSLPPIPAKHHYVDAPPSYRSLINLLYLYPKLLRQTEHLDNRSLFRRSSKQNVTRYSVRVCLIENTSEAKQGLGSATSESHTTFLRNFHNPAPWAGSPLIETVYTKIPGDVKVDDLKGGIPLRDEIKLQLPLILDGNQYLQFTLCAVDLADDLDQSVGSEQVSTEESCGLLVRDIAEAIIPLSSHSTRDPVSGNKVTTIIPNGCHRLKLGDFQLQVETRLLSSIHVNDPSLATALREFPLKINEDGERDSEMVPATNHKTVGEMNFISSLFAKAEPSVLVCHFQALMFMHLANLVKTPQSPSSINDKFLLDCIESLLEICGRARMAILAHGEWGQLRLDTFIKAAVDAFDESYFHPSKIQDGSDDDDAASDIMPLENSESAEQSASAADADNDDDPFDGGAIRKRKKDTFRSEIDTRISRTFSAMESPQVAFLRTAYGASKTDRMRLEAELDTNPNRYTHLVDDDETVVTFATGYSGDVRMAEAREAFERSKTPKPKDLPNLNSIEEQDFGPTPSHDFSYKTLSEMGLAKRVRSAAKVMLAPCVPPNFFTPSPRHSSSWHEEITPVDTTNMQGTSEEGTENEDPVIAVLGSDVESDSSTTNVTSDEIMAHFQLEPGVALRSPWHYPVFRFSIFFNPSQENNMRSIDKTEFLYESIMALWLRSTKGHRTPRPSPSTHEDILSNGVCQKFMENMEFLLPLCLKSIALRFGQTPKATDSQIARVIIDKTHMTVFESFFETIPYLLMKEAMAGMKLQGVDASLVHALAKLECLVDFLIGLYAMFHSAHTSILTKRLFQSLRYAETDGVDVENGDVRFEWTQENLHRVKCSRQLRLRVVEKLAVLPNFIALNYPMRFPSLKLPARGKKATWTKQREVPFKDQQLRAQDLLQDGEHVIPPSGWLAEILTRESLSISALSCEAVVAEAMAHIEENENKSTTPLKSTIKTRPTASLTREDLLMFQSIAIHGITCVHELLLRRHAMDRRYQKESTRGRIASLFAIPIFEKSLASVRWLARMESTHRVRSLWLLCFTYILQEAPENLLRKAVRSYSRSGEIQIHRFIRLLRLGSSTFQSFIDQQRYCMFPSEIDSAISPWLLQESFNTICATTIIVVEECASPLSTSSMDQQKMIKGILDLLLHILTTPQSSVTHLRAVGGAMQALERFGVSMFLETTGGSLQHWIRIVIGLLNSIALSVRSIAVDFVVSLLGSSFDQYGTIDELSIVFATVLPEVAAREIGLCSVSGHILTLEDAEKAIWPLRRSFADLEDTNPLDDDRVDPQLAPVMSLFSRACQAILDGVLIEMRLKGKSVNVVGTQVPTKSLDMYTFDADEESLFEAANFFLPESAPVQRIRWLMTLKALHQAKGQWVEAAESLMMCARAIADSIPHLKHVWRPSRFPLWSDSRRSLWLSTVGEDMGIPERGNDQVMSFADQFLEPELFEKAPSNATEPGKLKQPSLGDMCKLLTEVAREAVTMYDEEGGMDGLAYSRLESLLMILMEVLEMHGSKRFGLGRAKVGGLASSRQHVEEEASLRKVIASLSGDMTKLAERLLLLTEGGASSTTPRSKKDTNQHYFVRIVISGKKPVRFTESTTLPTFLEWNTPSICRVPKAIVDKAISNGGATSARFEEVLCSLVAKPIRNALLRESIPSASIIFRLGNQSSTESDNGKVVVDIGFVIMNFADIRFGGVESTTIEPVPKREDLLESRIYDGRNLMSKHFIYRKPPSASEVISSTFVEVTVANPFPCPLSRQRGLLTSEYIANN